VTALMCVYVKENVRIVSTKLYGHTLIVTLVMHLNTEVKVVLKHMDYFFIQHFTNFGMYREVRIHEF